MRGRPSSAWRSASRSSSTASRPRSPASRSSAARSSATESFRSSNSYLTISTTRPSGSRPRAGSLDEGDAEGEELRRHELLPDGVVGLHHLARLLLGVGLEDDDAELARV